MLVIPNGTVSHRLFSTLRIPVVDGRSFSSTEPENVVIVRRRSPKVLAGRQTLWAAAPYGTAQPLVDVIGIVGSVQAGRGADDRTTTPVYFPYVNGRW